MDPNVSLACCVSADFEMTHGIDVTMRRKFGNLAYLHRLQKKVTEVASLEIADRTYSTSSLKKSFGKSRHAQIFFKVYRILRKFVKSGK